MTTLCKRNTEETAILLIKRYAKNTSKHKTAISFVMLHSKVF